MVLLVKKSFADEVLKSRDISKLQKVQITDKNGHKKTVYKKAGEQPTEEKTSKKESQPVDKKRVAKYQDMLEKVKNGPDENALKVQGEIMDKEKATKYLENKLSRISGKSSSKIKNYADMEDENYYNAQETAQKKYGHYFRNLWMKNQKQRNIAMNITKRLI